MEKRQVSELNILEKKLNSDLSEGLSAREVTLADGTKATGAVLTILYGADAEEAAMEAFKRIMPTSSNQIDFNMTLGFVDTTVDSLK